MYKLLTIVALGASCSLLGVDVVEFPYPVVRQGEKPVLIRRASLDVLLDEEVRQYCSEHETYSGKFLLRMGERVDLNSPDAEKQCWKFVEELQAGEYDSTKLKTIMGSKYPSKCRTPFGGKLDTWAAAYQLAVNLQYLHGLKSEQG